MSTFLDLNPLPTVSIRMPRATLVRQQSPDTNLSADASKNNLGQVSFDACPTSRNDERKYGAANSRISTENPTHLNGVVYESCG